MRCGLRRWECEGWVVVEARSWWLCEERAAAAAAVVVDGGKRGLCRCGCGGRGRAVLGQRDVWRVYGASRSLSVWAGGAWGWVGLGGGVNARSSKHLVGRSGV